MIVEKSREMEVHEEKESGYSPAYAGDDLTDGLHETFDFRTDFEIVSYENFKIFFNK